MADATNETTPVPEGAARIGIVTVSDRASRGEYEDRGGPAVREYLSENILSPVEFYAAVISDEQPVIEAVLRDLASKDCCLIITTGGTGPAARDVTPEATEAVCQVMLPGFGEQMRIASLAKVATAILSRQTAGIVDAETADGRTNRALIINLPGQPKAISECLDAVMGAVPHGITLIGGPYLETADDRFTAFRPKSA